MIACRTTWLPAAAVIELFDETPPGAAPAAGRPCAPPERQAVGKVTARRRCGGTVEVEDLFVEPAYRKRGLGVALLARAAEAALRLHGRTLVLVSDDAGTGGLTAWYRRCGLQQTGTDSGGRAVLTVPIGRLLSRAGRRRRLEADTWRGRGNHETEAQPEPEL